MGRTQPSKKEDSPRAQSRSLDSSPIGFDLCNTAPTIGITTQRQPQPSQHPQSQFENQAHSGQAQSLGFGDIAPTYQMTAQQPPPPQQPSGVSYSIPRPSRRFKNQAPLGQIQSFDPSTIASGSGGTAPTYEIPTQQPPHQFSGIGYGFGATSTANQAPFGQTQLFGKSTTTSGFGGTAPIFGMTTQQPQQQPSGVLFSNPPIVQSPFWSSPQSGFGTGGLFAPQQNATGNVFATSGNTTFGQPNKTASFGFGGSTTTPSFGQQQTQNFQPSGSAGVFGTAGGFGTATPQLGTVVKFNPVTGTDTMQKSGITHSISTKHHCITCMKEYEAKSLEELRWEDYQCNRKAGPQQQSSFGAPTFGAPVSTASSIFGQTENKPAFGQSTSFGANNGFGFTGQPNQQTSFAKPTATFGPTPTTNAFGSFNTTAPAFSAATGVKPFGAQPTTNVFGATPTTQSTTFGTGSTFFGQANPQNSTSFFNKPAQPTFSSGQQPVFSFGQQTSAQNSLFQPPKPTTGFSSFGQTNLTSNTGFGQQPTNIFSQPLQQPFSFQKPAQSTFGQPVQPGFGLGSTQPANNSFFGNGKSLFSTNTAPTSFFNPTGGFMMPQQQPAQTFNTGMEQFPQPDFATLVEHMYEPFPHRAIFDGIEVKNYMSKDVTNPAILKKIIEDAPLPMSPTEDLIKRRTLLTVKPTVVHGSGKYSILADTYNQSSTEDNFMLQRSTGKRLVLRKSEPRTEKDLLEEYKNMCSPSSKSTSIFKKNIIDELNAKHGSDGEIEMKQSTPIITKKKISETVGSEETLKPGSPTSPRNFPLFKLNEKETDNEEQREELDVTPIPATRSSFPHNVASGTDSVIENVISPNSGGKSVRFVGDSEDFEAILGSSRHLSQEIPGQTDVDGDASTSYPCGVRLTQPDYYTVPPYQELEKYKNEKGRCIVTDFMIGRHGYGTISFPGETDITDLNINKIVNFTFRHLNVYPDDSAKPPVGQGLNKPALITLLHVWPRHPLSGVILKDPLDIAKDNFLDRLQAMSQKQDAELVDYRPGSGSWIFKVDHFSDYKFTDAEDDEEREIQLQRKKEAEQSTEIPMAVDNDEYVVDKIPPKRGLGGISLESPGASSFESIGVVLPPPLPLPSLQQPKYGTSGVIMRASYFDEESVSDDDISSSDMGTVNKLPIPSRHRVPAASAIKLPNKIREQMPKYYVLLNKNRVVPMHRSLLYSHNYMDIAMFKARSFKVGWGPGFSFVTTTATPSRKLQMAIDEERFEYKPNVIVQMKIENLSVGKETMDLEKHLMVVYEESIVTMGPSKIPMFTVSDGYNALLRHQDLADRLDNGYNETASYYNDVWKLCIAFWGPDATTPTKRRELFCNWLEGVTAGHVNKELELYKFETATTIKNIFVYLTGHNVAEAAELAMEKGFPQLGTLITQSSAQEKSKLIIREQLEQWKNSGYLNNIDKNILKIYLLLGGVSFISDVNVCEDLDWKIALAIHFWYMCFPGTSLIHSIQVYQQAFLTISCANKPTPTRYEFNSETVYDALYQIMMLYANKTTSLRKVINPVTYTDDPVDYRLCWLLLQVFLGLNVGTCSSDFIDAAHISFATQLENMGLWKWAIFPILFVKEESCRMHLVMGVLDRNLDIDRTSKDNIAVEDWIVKTFKIPPEWMHTVLANKSILLGRNVEAYTHLILKHDWQHANAVAVEHLIPDFISTGQCDKLYKLLNHLIPGKWLVFNWHTQSGLIINFLELYENIIKNKLNNTEKDIHEMRSNLTILCNSIKQFPVRSVKQKLAIAEVSRFVALLLKIVYCDYLKPTVENMTLATSLTGVLVMPPDYKIDELVKYIHYYLKIPEVNNYGQEAALLNTDN